MTDRSYRDLVKDFRVPVVPVEPPEVVLARRMRTVGRLRELQRREIVLGVRRRSRKKWLLLAAIVSLPAAVFAATRVAGLRDGAAAEASPVVVAARPAVPEAGVMKASIAPVTDVVAAEGIAAPVPAVAETSTRRARGRSAEPNRSTLAAENALMQRALVAARQGEEARASALLTEFLSRYPASPLAQNAEVERFRAQYRSGNVNRAKELAATYVGKHPGGMAEEEARRLAEDAHSSSASFP